MNWLSIVILVLIVGLVLWLTIDTIIYVVKRIKEKKQDSQEHDIKQDSTTNE